ncbi:MAG: UDP-N-acetylmuramoyl-tripeptide--D-alanyl-D-alanine ligase [Gammaproteobacteria bacterium]|nr:UDP-N-acetylmuramoyl-tripeptide--D-alanyl-D-alanine ligase [Gammaproteobacteria bacterium]
MFTVEGINDLKTLSDVIGGELFSNNESFTGITVDSREEVNGTVYLALKGENFDGDIFCQDAIDNGSIAVITENPETLGRFILVKDTYDALLKIASHHHKQINPITIAITGSNGKTTVKEMMGKILDSDKTIITKRNENNQFGIPYTILRCSSSTENLVLECGARHDGDFKKIAEYFAFDQLIITNINNSHVGIFGSIENIIQTKLELIKAVKKSGSVIEAAFKNLSKSHKLATESNEIKLYDSNDLNLNTVWFYNCEKDSDQNNKYLISLNSEDTDRQIKFEASIEHNCINAVLTSLALSQFEYDINDSMKNLSEFENPLKNRFHIHEISNYLVIDDTYNANPASMQSAMKTINDWKDERGRIVILGDMYDLGDHASQEHKKVINYALRMNKLRKLILVGDTFTNEIKEFSDKEREKIILIQNRVDDFPLPELTRDSSIKSRGVIHRYFKSDGGIILIKGSRAMKMERFVESTIKYLQ